MGAGAPGMSVGSILSPSPPRPALRVQRMRSLKWGTAQSGVGLPGRRPLGPGAPARPPLIYLLTPGCTQVLRPLPLHRRTLRLRVSNALAKVTAKRRQIQELTGCVSDSRDPSHIPFNLYHLEGRQRWARMQEGQGRGEKCWRSRRFPPP